MSDKNERDLLEMFEGHSDEDMLDMFKDEVRRLHYNPMGDSSEHPYSMTEIRGEILRRMRGK